MRRAAFPVRRRRVTHEDRRFLLERAGGRCECGCARDLAELAASVDPIAHDAATVRRRWEALEAQGFSRARKLYEVDHVQPIWAGGADTVENKQVLCWPAHDRKTRIEATQRRRAGRRRLEAVRRAPQASGQKRKWPSRRVAAQPPGRCPGTGRQAVSRRVDLVRTACCPTCEQPVETTARRAVLPHPALDVPHGTPLDGGEGGARCEPGS